MKTLKHQLQEIFKVTKDDKFFGDEDGFETHYFFNKGEIWTKNNFPLKTLQNAMNEILTFKQKNFEKFFKELLQRTMKLEVIYVVHPNKIIKTKKINTKISENDEEKLKEDDVVKSNIRDAKEKEIYSDRDIAEELANWLTWIGESLKANTKKYHFDLFVVRNLKPKAHFVFWFSISDKNNHLYEVKIDLQNLNLQQFFYQLWDLLKLIQPNKSFISKIKKENFSKVSMETFNLMNLLQQQFWFDKDALTRNTINGISVANYLKDRM